MTASVRPAEIDRLTATVRTVLVMAFKEDDSAVWYMNATARVLVAVAVKKICHIGSHK